MIIAARGRRCANVLILCIPIWTIWKVSKDVETIHLMDLTENPSLTCGQIAPVHEIYTPTQKGDCFSQKVVKEIEEKEAGNRCLQWMEK